MINPLLWFDWWIELEKHFGGEVSLKVFPENVQHQQFDFHLETGYPPSRHNNFIKEKKPRINYN